MDPDKKLRALAKQSLIYDINKRREYVKTLLLSGGWQFWRDFNLFTF
jgi:hypothetical protein